MGADDGPNRPEKHSTFVIGCTYRWLRVDCFLPYSQLAAVPGRMTAYKGRGVSTHVLGWSYVFFSENNSRSDFQSRTLTINLLFSSCPWFHWVLAPFSSAKKHWGSVTYEHNNQDFTVTSSAVAAYISMYSGKNPSITPRSISGVQLIHELLKSW